MFRRGHVKLLGLDFTTDVEYPDEGRHIVPDMMKRHLKKEDRCRALLVRIKTCYEDEMPNAGTEVIYFWVISRKIVGNVYIGWDVVTTWTVLKYCVLYHNDPRFRLARSIKLFTDGCVAQLKCRGPDGADVATLKIIPHVALLLLPDDAPDDYRVSGHDLCCFVDAMQADLVDFVVAFDAAGRPLRAVRPFAPHFDPHIVAVVEAINSRFHGVPYITEFYDRQGAHLGTAFNAHQLIEWLTSDLPAGSPEEMEEALAPKLPNGPLQVSEIVQCFL